LLFKGVDVDSDAEKLSPLLVVKKADPVQSPEADRKVEIAVSTEDSDYFTPDEPNVNPSSPLYESDKVSFFLLSLSGRYIGVVVVGQGGILS